MKVIETPAATATILSERIVLVRARSGVELSGEQSSQGDKLIEDSMPGSYGQIIDRAEDYSIMPIEVFQVLNANPKLKALAIVVHRNSSRVNAEIDRHFFQRPLEVFTSVEEARNWLEQIL